MGEPEEQLVLGVDPGLANLAFSLVGIPAEGPCVLRAWIEYSVGNRDISIQQVIHGSSEHAAELVRRYRPHMIVIEDMSCMIHKLPKLYAVSAAVGGAATALGTPILLLHPRTVKAKLGIKALGDHSKNKEAALAYLRSVGLPLQSDHVADAVLLALCGGEALSKTGRAASSYRFSVKE